MTGVSRFEHDSWYSPKGERPPQRDRVQTSGSFLQLESTTMPTDRFEQDVLRIVRDAIQRGEFDDRIREVMATPATPPPAARRIVTDPNEIPANVLPADLTEFLSPTTASLTDFSRGLPAPWKLDHMPGNGECQRYQDSQVTQSNGIKLFALRDPAGGYISGAVNIGWDKGIRIRNGDFVQATAKFPTHPGTWSAIWLMPIPTGDYPEVVIAEGIGGRSNRTQHSVRFHESDDRATASPVPIGSWHNYGVHLGEDGTHFYVDGVKVGSFGAAPSGYEWGLIYSLAIGGIAGTPPVNLHSAKAELATVRLWRPRV